MLTSLSAAAVCHLAGPWVGAGFGFPWFFVFIPIFWIALIVFIIVMATRRFRHGGFRGYGPGAGHGPWAYAGGSRAAEQTLAERFAQGDIDEVEYRARLEVLRANRPSEGA